MIAFYGMGLLGSSFVRALRRRGEGVRVWSRKVEKGHALEAVGAQAFDDPAEAAQGAARIHLTLSDDAAVDAVLERARAGFGPGTILVDHTTTSPTSTAARVARWAEQGFAFQHAPVFMGPQNALESTGVMLMSGEQARYEALAPELSKWTGKLVFLGPQPERAAAMKLLGNLVLMAITSGLADMLALGKALDVPLADIQHLFDFFNPAATAVPRLNRMLEADFAHPSWELAMARKDARLMMEEAQRAESRLAMIPAVAAEMDRWIARGHERDDWTVMASDSLARGAKSDA